MMCYYITNNKSELSVPEKYDFAFDFKFDIDTAKGVQASEYRRVSDRNCLIQQDIKHISKPQKTQSSRETNAQTEKDLVELLRGKIATTKIVEEKPISKSQAASRAAASSSK